MNWTELLFEAVEIDDVDLVRESLTHGADVHAIVDGRSILSASLSLRKRDEENIEIIQLLLEAGASPNRRSEDGKTVLYWAVFSEEKDIVQLLLSAGATVEAEEPEDGHTSVHSAAENGNREIMELLLSAGGKSVLNKFDYSYRTPLMWAAEKGELEVVRMLIDAGADVNAFDEIHAGTNALLEAVKRGGSYEMVALLVNAGADPTIPGFMGITALSEARRCVKFSTPSKEEALKVFALLEEAAKNL